MVGRIYLLIASRVYYWLNHLKAKFLIFFKFPFRGFGQVKMIGARAIDIGENTVIGDGSWINVNEPRLSSIRIGSNCLVGMNNFFSVGSKITIEDYFLSGARCSFICSSHKIQDVSRPYLKTGTTREDEIHIGKNVFFGYNVSVLGNVSIGACSIVGANSVVRTDLPNYSVAVGNPARVIKRYDFEKKCWIRSNDMGNICEREVSFHGNFYMPVAAVKKQWNLW